MTSWLNGLLWAQAGQPVTKSLDPELRAKLIGQFILLTIGGVALVTLAWLALRIARRHVQRTGDDERWSRSADRAKWEDWARRAIAMSDESDERKKSEGNDDA